MDQNLRNHITNNTEQLIRLTDYDELIEAVVQSGLLTQKARDSVEAIDLPLGECSEEWLRRERHKRLFLEIARQEDADVFINLKRILSDLGRDQAIRLLNEVNNDDGAFHSLHATRNVANHNHQHDGNQICSFCRPRASVVRRLEEYTGEIKPQQEFTVRKAQVIHKNTKVGTYAMKSQHNRGVLMVVNIIDFANGQTRRSGSDLDAVALLHLYKQMGFKLFQYENLNQLEFTEMLDALLKSHYTRETECFVLALMTHGDMQGNAEYVEFSDGSILNVNMILQKFTRANCPHLMGKPKVFLFPFCRGVVQDMCAYPHLQTDGFATNFEGDELTLILHQNTHTMQDMLVCYAAVPGFRTHRDPEKGSWYIQNYCKIMAENAHDTHLEEVVKLIHQATANLRTTEGAMQMGNYVNLGFNRNLFFNPGIWE